MNIPYLSHLTLKNRKQNKSSNCILFLTKEKSVSIWKGKAFEQSFEQLATNTSIWVEVIYKKLAFQFETRHDTSDEVVIYDSSRDVINILNSKVGKWKHIKMPDKDFNIFAYGSWMQKISNLLCFFHQNNIKYDFDFLC